MSFHYTTCVYYTLALIYLNLLIQFSYCISKGQTLQKLEL